MRVKVIVTMIVILAGLVIALFGQDAKAPAPVYKASESQTLKLENLQLKAQLAQKDLQAAQAQFQQALVNLTNEAAAVKKANGWPDDTQFDPNTVSFSAPPPKPAAAKGDKK